MSFNLQSLPHGGAKTNLYLKGDNMKTNTAYRDMPLSDAMQRQRERLFARMSYYAERGTYSALVTKESGLTGVFWMIVIRNGSEVMAKDIHYAGPDHAQRRADMMLAAMHGMPTPAKLATLTTQAFLMSDEFEREIGEQYGVTVADKSGAPWRVVFTGERSQLERMYADHWGDDAGTPDITEEA